MPPTDGPNNISRSASAPSEAESATVAGKVGPRSSCSTETELGPPDGEASGASNKSRKVRFGTGDNGASDHCGSGSDDNCGDDEGKRRGEETPADGEDAGTSGDVAGTLFLEGLVVTSAGESLGDCSGDGVAGTNCGLFDCARLGNALRERGRICVLTGSELFARANKLVFWSAEVDGRVGSIRSLFGVPSLFATGLGL